MTVREELDALPRVSSVDLHQIPIGVVVTIQTRNGTTWWITRVLGDEHPTTTDSARIKGLSITTDAPHQFAPKMDPRQVTAFPIIERGRSWRFGASHTAPVRSIKVGNAT